MNWILVMLGCHYVADMPMQTNWMAELKGKRWYILMSHALIYAFIVSIGMAYKGVFAEWKFSVIFATHMIIDNWKSRQPKDDAHWYLIYIDQSLHLLINALLFLM